MKKIEAYTDIKTVDEINEIIEANRGVNDVTIINTTTGGSLYCIRKDEIGRMEPQPKMGKEYGYIFTDDEYDACQGGFSLSDKHHRNHW